MTLDYLDYINPQREKYGLPPLRACGKLEKCIKKSMIEFAVDQTGPADLYDHLEEVGLPSSSKLLHFTQCSSMQTDYNGAFQDCLKTLKNDATFGIVNGDDLIHGCEDYTYLAAYFYYDEKNVYYYTHISPEEQEGGLTPYKVAVYLMK